jgi:hypothetical protein
VAVDVFWSPCAGVEREEQEQSWRIALEQQVHRGRRPGLDEA